MPWRGRRAQIGEAHITSNKAKDKARLVVCIGNHKQIAMAFTMYAGDSDDLMPAHLWYTDWAGAKGSHHYSPVGDRPLNPYLGMDTTKIDSTPKSRNAVADGVVRCPSDKGDPLTGVTASENARYGNSYIVQRGGSNINIGQVSNSSTTSKRITDFEFPEMKVMAHASVMRDDRSWLHPATNWHNQPRPMWPVSYTDGHAATLELWRKDGGTNTHTTHGMLAYRSPTNTNIERDGYY